MAVIFIRTIIVFLALLLFMRLLGKRQLGELELNELVVSVLVANLVSQPLQDIGTPLLYGLLPVLILFCCEILISGAAAKSIRLRSLIYGRPSVLIENGVICQREMEKNRFTPDELAEELRKSDILDISKVKLAVLETNGILNTLLSAAESPVTASQMGITPEEEELPLIVISGGRVLGENLKTLGRDRRWLEKELRSRGAKGPEEVYLMTLSRSGKVYYAEKERRS